MAIPALAARAAQLGVKYAPQVVNTAEDLLKKVTSGRVSNLTDVKSYVGGSAERLAVTSRALVQAGFDADDVMPADLIGRNEQLQAVRASLDKIVVASRTAYDSGTQARLNDMSSDTEVANDVLKKNSVEAVLRIYGTADAYFLCHPNGGVPRGWFTWYNAMFKRRG